MARNVELKKAGPTFNVDDAISTKNEGKYIL